jgi:Flp pilus assembly protein TadG
VLVEFALVVPLLLVLVLGLSDFGRAFHYWIDTTSLANVTARYAAVNKNPGAGAATPQTLQRYMELQASTKALRDGGTRTTAVDVCISFPSGTTPNVGDPVTVEVKSTWSWLGFLIDRTGIAPTSLIKGHATMRLEAKPTNYVAGCT